jgi:hypothetical protein
MCCSSPNSAVPTCSAPQRQCLSKQTPVCMPVPVCFASLQEQLLDVLRALSSPNLDIRRKTLDIALDLITSRNIDEVSTIKQRVCAWARGGGGGGSSHTIDKVCKDSQGGSHAHPGGRGCSVESLAHTSLSSPIVDIRRKTLDGALDLSHYATVMRLETSCYVISRGYFLAASCRSHNAAACTCVCLARTHTACSAACTGSRRWCASMQLACTLSVSVTTSFVCKGVSMQAAAAAAAGDVLRL